MKATLPIEIQQWPRCSSNSPMTTAITADVGGRFDCLQGFGQGWLSVEVESFAGMAFPLDWTQPEGRGQWKSGKMDDANYPRLATLRKLRIVR